MEIFLTYCVNSKVASVAEQSRASRVRAVGGDAWREYVSQNNVGTSRARVKPLGFFGSHFSTGHYRGDDMV